MLLYCMTSSFILACIIQQGIISEPKLTPALFYLMYTCVEFIILELSYPTVSIQTFLDGRHARCYTHFRKKIIEYYNVSFCDQNLRNFLTENAIVPFALLNKHVYNKQKWRLHPKSLNKE